MAEPTISRRDQFFDLMNFHWLVRFSDGIEPWNVTLWRTREEAEESIEEWTALGYMCFLYELKSCYGSKAPANIPLQTVN